MFFASEYIIFILVAVVISACVMDEEPILDLTDLNAAHVLTFSSAILIVAADNLIKMSRGQYANADRQVYAYVGFKTNVLIFYFFIIWVIFFLHTTPPLLVDCVEAVNMWSIFNNIVGVALLRPVLILFILQGLLSFILQSRSCGLTRLFFTTYLCTLLISFWSQLWELLGKTSSSVQQKNANSLSNLSSMSASPLTYAELGGEGGFDWHAATNRPVAFFFLDLASLSAVIFSLLLLAILLIVSIVCAIVGGFFTDISLDWVDCSALLAFSRSLVISLACLLLCNYIGFSFLFMRSLTLTSTFSWL